MNVRTAGPGSTLQVALTGLVDNPAFTLDTYLRGIVVTTARGMRTPGGSQRELRVQVPVTREACRRLATRVGGACGSTRASRAADNSAISFTFRRTVFAHLEARGGRDARVRHAVGPVANVAVNADVTTLTIACEGVHAEMQVSGGGSVTAVPLPCSGEDQTTWWLTRLPTAGTATELQLSSIKSLRASGAAERSVQTIRDGVLQVGDEDHFVRADRGRDVTVRAGPGGARFTIQGGETSPEIVTRVEARAASSVLDGREERLPTEFSRHSDLWLALVGIVASLLATVGNDALIRSRWVELLHGVLRVLLVLIVAIAVGTGVASGAAQRRAACGSSKAADVICKRSGTVTLQSANGKQRRVGEKTPRVPRRTTIRVSGGGEAGVHFGLDADCDLGPAPKSTVALTRPNSTALFRLKGGRAACDYKTGKGPSFGCSFRATCDATFTTSGTTRTALDLSGAGARAAQTGQAAEPVVIDLCTGSIRVQFTTANGTSTSNFSSPGSTSHVHIEFIEQDGNITLNSTTETGTGVCEQ